METTDLKVCIRTAISTDPTIKTCGSDMKLGFIFTKSFILVRAAVV